MIYNPFYYRIIRYAIEKVFFRDGDLINAAIRECLFFKFIV